MMTSPYLDTQTRSLEQLRDELRAQILGFQATNAPNSAMIAYLSEQTAIACRRLAAVEAEIERSKT